MFKNISKIRNLKEKKFFIEKIEFLIKLINSFAIKQNLQHEIGKHEISNLTIERLKQLNIIEADSADEQKQLKAILKTQLYLEFIAAINFNIKFNEEIGDLLDKLDPSRRKEIQERVKEIKAPRTIDFFCGAGGLSLGFSQEGFKIDLANDYEDVCIETFKYNHPEVPDNRVILGDIRSIVDHIEDYVDKEIDVVIGEDHHVKVLALPISKEL
jgi:DNA (cytosine-5)-methyltransferase 1